MNEGRLKECWERTKDNGEICGRLCIICVMAPCIEPCLFCCPAGEPIKIEREDPNRPDWLVKIPNPDFPKKALWAIDEGACRDWEMGKDMSKWERKYAPKKEVKIAPEPEEKEDISKLSHYERRKRAIQAGHELGVNEGATDDQGTSG